MNEREYFTSSNAMTAAPGWASTGSAPASSLVSDSSLALAASEGLHSLISDLEDRLFGAQPREVSVGNDPNSKPMQRALADSVRGTKQRLDSAADRLQGIINRL